MNSDIKVIELDYFLAVLGARDQFLTNTVEFTIDYFLGKFEAIPDDKWARRWLSTKDGKKCAVGHCGALGPWDIEHLPEAIALIEIFVDNGHDVFMVNDLGHKSPKENVLEYLRDFKK